MNTDTEIIKNQVKEAVLEFLNRIEIKAGDIFVIGCSSSEIIGGHIGKNSSEEAGKAVIAGIMPVLQEKGIYLAVQCCEHLNRALLLEREAAERYNYEIVNVIPALNAGGSCAVAAYNSFNTPVAVEKITAKAGMDIGDTFIGMHIKHVQVPFRGSIKEIGNAHVTYAFSRPKYIGGERAVYKKVSRKKNTD